ncbi:hypothetical protein FA95DRAFT_1613247 [Auriscalpium vulgare]|uniref:Uncharacterized protein n=1 Tax=Auriscalpium vulgare TaxID=40419 RepID=A0ACB8R3D4_9AGAM|nr:hypothetical protein FA95DRAFT_1613247 [Auriscalpium vulgare]
METWNDEPQAVLARARRHTLSSPQLSRADRPRMTTRFSQAESELLARVFASPDVRALLLQKGKGKFDLSPTRIADIVVREYRDAFDAPFPAESEEAYQARRAAAHPKSHCRVEQKAAEMVEAHIARMTKAPDRIYNWVKNHTSKAPTRYRGIPRLPQPKHRTASVSGYTVYFKSDKKPAKRAGEGVGAYSARCSAAWHALSPEERAQWTATAAAAADTADSTSANDEHPPSQDGGNDDNDHAEWPNEVGVTEFQRAQYAESMPYDVARTLESWKVATGWVGMVMVRGIDAVGQVASAAHFVGKDSKDRNLRERLAANLKVSAEDINNSFVGFLNDVFQAHPGGSHPAAHNASNPLSKDAQDQIVAFSKAVLSGNLMPTGGDNSVRSPAASPPRTQSALPLPDNKDAPLANRRGKKPRQGPASGEWRQHGRGAPKPKAKAKPAPQADLAAAEPDAVTGAQTQAVSRPEREDERAVSSANTGRSRHVRTVMEKVRALDPKHLLLTERRRREALLEREEAGLQTGKRTGPPPGDSRPLKKKK